MLKIKRKYQYEDMILKLRGIQYQRIFIVDTLSFDIYNFKKELVGECDLRLINNEENYYAGNIGYMVYK
ncbi:MAG: hypothetical protein WBO70_02720, partial [Erysipelotrichaceae bacterium]